MKQETLSALDLTLKSSPILRAKATPSDVELAQATNQLGVPLSADYREFLLRYGGAMVGPFPIFGLRPVEAMDDDLWSVITVTRRYREAGVPGADAWVVISEDHAGNPIGMDGNGRIWIHDHDFGGTALLATSFEEYIRVRCLNLPGADQRGHSTFASPKR